MMIQSECVTIHLSEEEAEGLRREILALVAVRITKENQYLLQLLNTIPKRIES